MRVTEENDAVFDSTEIIDTRLLLMFQIADEKFLVLINDMLASGEIADLFPEDELENILGSLRSEVKGQGLIDTRENCNKFFIERVRKQLKVRNSKLQMLYSTSLTICCYDYKTQQKKIIGLHDYTI